MTFRTALLPALLLAFALFALPAASTAQEADGLSDLERSEVETLVRDYILANPEVILEAVQRLQARQQAEEQARAKAALTDRGEAIRNDPRDPSVGPDDAPVTLVEFFDYQCGYCKRIFPAMTRLIEEQEGVRIVFKEFPILGPASEVASRAALAAEAQGRFLPFHRALMTLRGELTEDKILDTAASVGLDLERLEADMQSEAITAHIEETRGLAREIGVTGTPAFVVGDTLVPGAVGYDRLVALIEEARTASAE